MTEIVSRQHALELEVHGLVAGGVGVRDVGGQHLLALPAQVQVLLGDGADVLNGGVGGTTIVDQRVFVERYLSLEPRVIGASVWSIPKSLSVGSGPTLTSLSKAETTPTVTDAPPGSPSGFPMATA